jgi:ketosteroid isomerase-like protein
MNLTTTRNIAEAFVAARTKADASLIESLLSPEVEWRTPKSIGIGTFRGAPVVSEALAGAAAGSFLKVETIVRKVHDIIVDGATAVILQRLTGQTLDGKEYVNDYVWVLRCRDGRIVKLDEYADTLHAHRLGLAANESHL